MITGEVKDECLPSVELSLRLALLFFLPRFVYFLLRTVLHIKTGCSLQVLNNCLYFSPK